MGILFIFAYASMWWSLMELINEIITPLNNNKDIDLFCLNKMIELSFKNHNDYILLFSVVGDGFLLTLQEKEAIINSIDSSFKSQLIYYFQLLNSEYNKKEINLINRSDITYVMLSPPLGYIYPQNGLELYIKTIVKQLKNKKIILLNNYTNTCFHLQTIKNLMKANNNIIGLYENSNDLSLVRLLKQNNPDFKIYINEKNFSKSLDMSLTGIVSSISILYGTDYKNIYLEFKNGYTDTLALNYLSLLNEVLSFSNNSILLKNYLKRLGFSSMEVRLPLIIDKNDIENLDLLI